MTLQLLYDEAELVLFFAGATFRLKIQCGPNWLVIYSFVGNNKGSPSNRLKVLSLKPMHSNFGRENVVAKFDSRRSIHLSSLLIYCGVARNLNFCQFQHRVKLKHSADNCLRKQFLQDCGSLESSFVLAKSRF